MSILDIAPERKSELAGIRAKVLANTATQEDMKRAIIILREGRLAAQEAAKHKGAARGLKAPIDVEKLFSELR